MRISDWSSDVCSSDLRVQRRAGPDIFVIGDHGVALAALDRHRDDLVPEPARAARRLSLVLARDGEAVLLLAGYLVTLGQIFGRDAHMIAVEEIGRAHV